MPKYGRFYYALRQDFTFPFIWSKQGNGGTDGKPNDWSIQINLRQRSTNQRMALKRLLVDAGFIPSRRKSAMFFVSLRLYKLNYFKCPRQYISKIHDSICGSSYYTSSDSYTDFGGCFEVDIMQVAGEPDIAVLHPDMGRFGRPTRSASEGYDAFRIQIQHVL